MEPARRGLECLEVRFRASGLGFRVWGLGFRVWGLGFGVYAAVGKVWGLGVCGRGISLSPEAPMDIYVYYV